MRIINLFSLLVISLAIISCQSKNPTGVATEVATEAGEQLTGQTFGEGFTPADVLAYSDLDAKVSATDSTNVTVRGTVSEVCQMKGCWMTMVQADGSEGMMVRFKDYGFFMPKDISGREVVMHGKAFYRTTSVDELRHYAEDAGKSAEEIAAITAPKNELAFLADGVILLDEAVEGTN